MDFQEAANQVGDGLVAAYEADPREALGLITGLFVGLVEDGVRRSGGDPSRQIKIDSRGERDITIHVRGAAANDNPSTLWIAGKWLGAADGGAPAWELQGVFDTEAAAEAACVEPVDFIGPVQLGQRLPQDATAWPGCRYPLATGG